ncbi:MAG TPA: CDP-diacylglycerol--glycerol-3-phosphate 3-phosphatidyltransferase [Azospirillaceae bacterium]|nr:CDP-diacylglycerol--glycerol-3-phosphate 3-phosphatidyltransferase [Azospirillaceae bacterium]
MLFNLPNILTLARIAVIPVIVALFYVPADWAAWAACALFTAAAVTDYLDGYLARAWAQVSAIGKFLDPIADKLLVAAVLFMLVATDRMSQPSIPAAVVILLREVLVSGLREYLAGVQVSLPVSQLAKWKTAMQLVALGILIVGDAGPDGLPVRAIGEFGLWIAAILTMVTGWDYLRSGVQHMADADAAPGKKPVPPGTVAGGTVAGTSTGKPRAGTTG